MDYGKARGLYDEFSSKIEDAVNTYGLGIDQMATIIQCFTERYGEEWEQHLIGFVNGAILQQAEFYDQDRFDARNQYYANMANHLVKNFDISVTDEDREFGSAFIQFAHRYLIKNFFDAVFTMDKFSAYKESFKDYTCVNSRTYIPYEEYKLKYIV